jgi:polyphosphate kinase
MKKTKGDPRYKFLDRDVSWLSFNERVLEEAQRNTVPLMERIRFLGIYSSNLDEFYRVRMPAIKALSKLSAKSKTEQSGELLSTVSEKVIRQQKRFGGIIENEILAEIKKNNIHLAYSEAIPESIQVPVNDYFIHSVATHLQVIKLTRDSGFFPENNKLYFAVVARLAEKHQLFIVTIPSDVLPRFFSRTQEGIQYIVFLDDIIKLNLYRVFPEHEVISSHSFKITRDAELNIQDEYIGDLALKIEEKINERDLGLATRFLYQPDMTEHTLRVLLRKLKLKGANVIPGGRYHNLKDLSSFPLSDKKLHYEPWAQLDFKIDQPSLFQELVNRDILLHTPYHSYKTVLRFFNEAAINPAVEKIYVTLYRVASDSCIASALITAAKNGKEVVVFVELKARFDEANNIKWSKKMKAAGVQIIESIPGLKVHAKIALVKTRIGNQHQLLGLLATGNFNESTARYYTDHVLMTSHDEMLQETETLFEILRKQKKKLPHDKPHFKHLLVGQFNLQARFTELIDREINHARNGLPAYIVIKFNNLEERVLISKLYEASSAGVKIILIVRGVCCLIPGVPGMSENISVRRIVDRYLEHGRVFIFGNKDSPEVYLGSADWMNRNIYRRIEVCFPVYDPELKSELIGIVNIQLKDNDQAVAIDDLGNNVPIANDTSNGRSVRRRRSQKCY